MRYTYSNVFEFIIAFMPGVVNYEYLIFFYFLDVIPQFINTVPQNLLSALILETHFEIQLKLYDMAFIINIALVAERSDCIWQNQIQSLSA